MGVQIPAPFGSDGSLKFYDVLTRAQTEALAAAGEYFMCLEDEGVKQEPDSTEYHHAARSAGEGVAQEEEEDDAEAAEAGEEDAAEAARIVQELDDALIFAGYHQDSEGHFVADDSSASWSDSD